MGSSPTTATQSFEYWKLDDASRSPFAALKRTRLSKGTTDLVDREMRYDAVGNVTRIVDGINTETVDYTYDDLDRLLTASVPAGESFAYDKIGNMTSKAGTTLNYGTTAPKHAVKSHGSTTYTYDANGSMTARGTQTIKYDPEQRPILVKDGASVHRASYDGDGVRRKREDGNGTVHYLGGYERKLAAGANPEAVTKYYSASLGAISRPLAFRRAGTLHWVGSDHLGGTIRVLNGSFTALDGMRYKPYGEDRDTGTSLNTDRKFTGQTEDETAGLYWYASRAYDPAIGRFVSPDDIVPDPSNPQSLNRYGYAYNNPLRYTDPTGHYNVEDDTQWVKEFSEQYGHAPTASDKAFRQYSMEAELRGDEWSVKEWVSNNYSPTPSPAPTPDPRPAPSGATHRPTSTPASTPSPQPAPTPYPPYSSGSSSAALHLDTPSASLLSHGSSVLGIVADDAIDSLGRVANLSDDVVGRTKRAATGALKGAGRLFGYVDAYQEELAAGKSEGRAHWVGVSAVSGSVGGEALVFFGGRGVGRTLRSISALNPVVSNQIARIPILGKIVEAGGGAVGAEASKAFTRWLFDQAGLD